MRARALAVLVLASAPAGTFRLPHHDFAIVGTAEEVADPRRLVPRLAAALARTLEREGLGTPGYPRACQVVFTPVPERPAASTITCLDREPLPPGRLAHGETGLRLDPEERFLEFSVIRAPDERVWLMEIFVVAGLPEPRLDTDRRFEVPRLAVHLPDVPARSFPGVLRAVEAAVRALGARPLERPAVD